MKESMNKDEVLSKVTRYELERAGSKRIFIDIHEIVANTTEIGTSFKFMAVPNLVLGGTKEEYIITADTAENALTKCLDKLKDVADFLEVLERPVNPS